MSRDPNYSPFKSPPPDPPRREAETAFVMARLRGHETDSMRGSLRPGPHGVEALYTLNGELYRAAVVRVGGAGAGRPGDTTGRARGRRVDAGHVFIRD